MNAPSRLLTSRACNIRGDEFNTRWKTDDSGIPLVLHSDSAVCWPLTDWLLHLFVNHHKPATTLVTYSDHLSPFLKFLDLRQLRFEDVSNAVLFDMRFHYLKDPHKKSNNQINKIIRRTLEALIFLQRSGYFGERRVIGVDTETPDAQVVVSDKTGYFRSKKGQLLGRKTLWHPSLLPRSIQKTRFPIAESTIDALWASVGSQTRNPHVTQRAELMLLLFESTGKRRVQISKLTVESVKTAFKSGRLLFPGAKRGDDHEVPIARETVIKALSYISGPRADCIKRSMQSGRLKSDHGYLLVSDRGTAWATRCISNEFLRYKNQAGIREPAHAHIFRDRWFTLQTAALSAQVDSPLARSTLSAKLRSRGGHKSDQGVSAYIDLHFNELDTWREAERAVDLKLEHSVASRLINALTSQIELTKDDALLKTVAELRDLLQRLLRNSDQFI